MNMNVMKKASLSILLIAAGFLAYYSYKSFSKETILIRSFIEEKDFSPLVEIINQDHFLLSERRQFNAETALIDRAPGGDERKKGIALIDVGELEGKTVGFVAYYKKNLQEGTIWLLGVAKDFRGRGIAKSLLLHALAELKKKNVDYVTIATRSINTPALSLYKKMGFKELEHHKDRGMIILKKTF